LQESKRHAFNRFLNQAASSFVLNGVGDHERCVCVDYLCIIRAKWARVKSPCATS
jgi:hypothetical protein